jgi:hypothetical protein
MKLGITKEQIPALLNGLACYCGGMIAGIGLGMLIATRFVPEDDQKMFRFQFYVIALSCVFAGGFVANIPVYFQRKKSRHDLVDEKHVA